MFHCPNIVPILSLLFSIFFPHFTTSPVVKRFTSTRSSKKNRWKTLQTANSNWKSWKAMLCKSLSKICETSLSLPSMNYNTVSVRALTKRCTRTGASKDRFHWNIWKIGKTYCMPPKKITTTLRACLCWAFHSRGKQVIEPVQLLNQEKQQTMPTGAMIHGYSWHMFEAPAGCAQSSRSVFAPVQGRKGSEKTTEKSLDPSTKRDRCDRHKNGQEIHRKFGHRHSFHTKQPKSLRHRNDLPREWNVLIQRTSHRISLNALFSLTERQHLHCTSKFKHHVNIVNMFNHLDKQNGMADFLDKPLHHCMVLGSGAVIDKNERLSCLVTSVFLAMIVLLKVVETCKQRW